MSKDTIKFRFNTKARVLEQLKDVIPGATVLDVVRVSYQSWTTDREATLHSVTTGLSFPLIVRSTSSNEDTAHSSLAGAFNSVANVKDQSDLAHAIDTVFASYRGEPGLAEEVFIQPMVENVSACGVVMTHCNTADWQYHVLEFSRTGKTDDITNGSAQPETLTYIGVHGAPYLPEALKPVDRMIENLKEVTQYNNLDVEFAIDEHGTLYLLQVRPFVELDEDHHEISFEALQSVSNRIDQACKSVSSTIADPAFFSVMTDWNPAEMIGAKPRPLALSLYRTFITDLTWAVARKHHGYKDCRGTPLMHIFGGTPYIDVSASFQSFIPDEVNPRLSRKVISSALSWLSQYPHLHDKAEFQVIPTCYTPSLEGARPDAFTSLEDREWHQYTSKLHQLTQKILESGGHCDTTKRRIQELRQQRAKNQSKQNRRTLNETVWSIRKKEATSFAEVARLAFIFTAIAKDIEKSSLAEKGFADRLLISNDLVVSEISDDLTTKSKKKFLKNHGHIRPGTYEITVPRYDQNFDGYFLDADQRSFASAIGHHDPLTDADKSVLETVLHNNHLAINAKRFIRLARWAISERERVKYDYAKCVSDLLQNIQDTFEAIGVSAEDTSFLTLDQIVSMSLCFDMQKDTIQELARIHRDEWKKTTGLRMPEVVTSGMDILCFEALISVANFVGTHSVEAEACTLDQPNLEGRIVLIENADPGYDWLFSRKIIGLVTKYGGENSHMAVRARELGLTAVIGCGEAFFEYCNSTRLRIDPVNKTVEKTQ